MRRSPFRGAMVALAAVTLIPPTTASAQVRLLIEGGLSWPSGDFSKAAEPGYHGGLGLQAGVGSFPLSFRAEGDANRFPSTTSTGHVTVVSGAGSAVLSLGSAVLGGSPYVLAGIGHYQTSFSDVGVSSSIGTGFHIGVGLSFGAVGYGGFVELRFVNVKGDSRTTRYIPISVGLRL